MPSRTVARAAAAVLWLAAALLLWFAAGTMRSLQYLRVHAVHGRAFAEVAALPAAVALLAAAFLLCARLRPARRLNVALAVASAGLVAYSIELLLDTWLSPPRRILAERQAVVADLRGRGVGAVLPLYPNTVPEIRLDGQPALALAGMSRKTIVLCRENRPDWITYRSDEHGFANPEGAWRRVDAAAVGDSFTAGECVPPERSLVANLRATWPATLNAGYGGNGPLMMLATVREYLSRVRPRVVLWNYCAANDLIDLDEETRRAVLRRYLTDDGFTQGLFDRQPSIDEELGRIHVVRLTTGLRPMAWRDLLSLRSVRRRLGFRGSNFSEGDVDLLVSIVSRARAAVAAWGGRLHFVYLPDYVEVVRPRMIGDRAWRALRAQTAGEILARLRREGIPVVDLRETFSRDEDPSRLFACPNCHYSEDGYRAAAQAIVAGVPPP